jgi:hypothetical protein
LKVHPDFLPAESDDAQIWQRAIANMTLWHNCNLILLEVAARSCIVYQMAVLTGFRYGELKALVR